MERARLLLGCYRRSDAADPDTYVLAIAAVLSCYEEQLIAEVTDPRTGISTHEKFAAFPPNPGELKRYCEDRAARRARLGQYAEMPTPDFSRPQLAPPVPKPGRRANVFVHRDCPRYGEMCERAHKPEADPAEFEWHPEGIKVSLTWWRTD
jgi:hypothetical protein